jgi:hypothetical protein
MDVLLSVADSHPDGSSGLPGIERTTTRPLPCSQAHIGFGLLVSRAAQEY